MVMVSTSKELLETRRSEYLRRALAALTPDQQKLLLRYHEDEQSLQSRKALCEELGISMNALRIRVYSLRRKVQQYMEQLAHDEAPTTSAEEPNLVSPASASEPTHRQAPLMDHFRQYLQTHFPVLYAQVLEPTLADLREEHSAALANGPLKARCILLRGCTALAAAGICQLGSSLLGRIAALWQARSSK